MGIGYKLFRVKNNKLYPLYVESNVEVPIGVWLEAKSGERLPSGKVKAKLGNGLAFRPGWHLNDIAPYVEHIGKRDKDGNLIQRSNTVWAEVEYADQINYQNEANERGRNKLGKVVPVKACLNYIPVNGYYRFKTNPNMFGEWIISGAIKVNRILSNDEVDRLCLKHGLHPQKRDLDDTIKRKENVI